MRKTILFCFALLTGFSFGQDMHFAQLNNVQPLMNPALTSAFKGFERVSIQHRNQWIQAGTKFSTSNIAAEFSLNKKRGRDRAYAGVGMFFNNDVGGDSKFSISSGGLLASGNIPIKEGNWLSAGLQMALNSRSADFSRLIFYNQWNGANFDPNISSGELNGKTSFTYIDAGAGVSFRHEKTSNVKRRTAHNGFILGASFQHLNRPDLRYSALGLDRVYTKFCFHGQFRFGLTDVSGLEVNVAQFLQGPHKETNIGLLYVFHMKEGMRTATFRQDQNLYAGLFFRVPGAFTPYIALDFRSFRAALSYDYDLGKINIAYRHSIEFCLNYTFNNKSMFSR